MGISINPVRHGAEIKNLNTVLIKDKWLRETNLLLSLGDGNELIISLAKPDPSTRRTTNAFCPVLLTVAFKDSNGNFVFDNERELPLHCWINMTRATTLHDIQFDMGLARNVAGILVGGDFKTKPSTDEVVDHVIQGLKQNMYNDDADEFRATDIAQELENSWPPRNN